MKINLTVLLLALAPLATAFSSDVLQYHVNAACDGLYLEPLFTKSAAASLRRDKS